jgi:hypothetical protein
VTKQRSWTRETTVPWSTALCFSDPLSFQAAISTADLKLLPTARGHFRAELTKVCMNQLWVQRCYQNLPLMIAAQLSRGAEYLLYQRYRKRCDTAAWTFS